jgi:soluble cytochrome b562
MADGDISGGSSSSMMDTANKGVKFIDDFASLFRGTSTSNSTNKNIDVTTTTQEEVDPAKAKALLEQLLSGVQGLAAVSSGQKAAGIYDSTTNTQMVNDLLSSSTASIAALGKKTTQEQNGTITDSSSQHKKGALEWIVCTELYLQKRLPHRYYRHGFKIFAAHSDKTKQGYYYWAVGAVKHLRKYPNSKLSKFLEVTFNARAEYLAAEAGERVARKTVLGFLVKHITYAICVILSRTVARKPTNWFNEVYGEFFEEV